MDQLFCKGVSHIDSATLTLIYILAQITGDADSDRPHLCNQWKKLIRNDEFV